MPSKKFFSALNEVLDKIGETQDTTIQKVATWAADAIAADRFAILFGTGHSFLVTADAFPRIGAYPGWLPLHELSTSYHCVSLGKSRHTADVVLRKPRRVCPYCPAKLPA
jgi:hypothetical protein